MEYIKINSHKDISNLINILEKDVSTIDISECNNSDKTKVIYFLSGATFNRGSIKKISKDQFVVDIKC